MSKAILFVCAVGLLCLLQAPCLSAAELKCYECDSTNAKCIDDPTSLPAGTPGDDTTQKCFVKSDNGKISRGIMLKTEACAAPGCVECNESNCNKNLICQNCDSANYANCAQMEAVDVTRNAICAKDTTKCFVLTNSDKNTVRGCVENNIPASCDGEACSECTTPNCNAQLFPANRLKCYQCSGSDACGQFTGLTAKACVKYDKSDKCTMYGTTSADMVRGCSSDADPKCTADAAVCPTCDTSSCNNNPFERTPECKICNDDTETKCSGDIQAKKCEKPVKFNQANICYTQTSADGKTSRGCLNDKFASAEACSAQNSCTACATNDCSQQPTELSCIVCRSDTLQDCWDNAKVVPGEKCPIVEGRKPGCYHGIWYGVANRGCMSTAVDQVYAQCLENKECKFCDNASNCNIQKSKASFVIINTTLLGLMLFLRRYF